MKPIFLSVLFALQSIFSFGQYFSNRIIIDSNLSVGLPFIYDTTIRNDYNMYKCQLKDISLAVIVVKNRFNVKSQRDFDISVKGVLTGMFNTNPALKNYQSRISDTLLGGTSGKFIRFFDGKGTYPLDEFQLFITIQDSSMYSLEAGLANHLQLTKQQTDSFFQSAKFTGKMPLTQGSNITIDTLPKLLLAPLIFLSIIIVIILKLTKRI